MHRCRRAASRSRTTSRSRSSSSSRARRRRTMRILAVSGSLRRDSHNSRLLRAAAQKLPPGVELELYGGLKQIPPFNEDDEATPAAEVQAWRAAIRDADALLFATPEYNSSIPGQLKNAVDWAS